MADLSLLQEDLQEEIDGFGVDDYSSETDVLIVPSALDFISQDEMLTPLGRLDKYAASENIFNRQMVARSLLDTLKAVSDDEKDCIAVLERVTRLADDSEPMVRAELMEQVPHIAVFCQENRPSIPYAFSKYLLPIVVRYLADQNNQVRKTSQSALLILLEQEIIERYDVEEKVCPVLIDLTAPDSNDDVKTEAVAIMCKMAPMVGRDITERLILPRFCEMCCDSRMFHVRKVCAANFGDICSVVGQEATEEMLLPRFFQLCSDNVWGVRKACAECFMAVSCATAQETRRTKLSSVFINLISDPSKWVRQAAFQSLGPFISTFANPSSSTQYFREEELRSEDCQKSMENSTSTERKDNTTADSDTCGDVIIEPTIDDFHSSCHVALECILNGDPQRSIHEQDSNSESCDHTSPCEQCTSAFTAITPCMEVNRDSRNSSGAGQQSTDNLNSAQECETIAAVQSILEQEQYNSFHYWRTPIPEINIDLELLQTDKEVRLPDLSEAAAPYPSSISTATRKELEEMIENLEPHIDDPDVKAQVQVLAAALRASSLDLQEETSSVLIVDNRIESENSADTDQQQRSSVPTTVVPLITETIESINSSRRRLQSYSEQSTNSSFSAAEEGKSRVQNIIPQALLEQYLSMTDPSRAQTVDTEIAKHCAYSLPGVALTLGRQNWHCLKNTYETLASDIQWKVRRTLAFSIHELAVILGDHLTAADLVPIFNGFLKDLDEVRIGVLKHLYDFLKLLHFEKRREYLYQLQEFLVTDNSRNWRFRAELAQQLILLLELYSATDVYEYLRPIALTLCTDKVSSVRWISFKLISEMIRKLHCSASVPLMINFLHELIDKFCCCSKWSGRQTFVFICQAIIEEDCLPMDLFALHLLPHLLRLASDRVPNVRVLLAKTLRQTLLDKEYFLNSSNSDQEAVEQTIMALQMDHDSDVKYFASVHPSNTKIADDAMSTTSSTY
ncbi:serine/threonine-protein phosphatase 4 regulatory subunit 1 isoform X1 [Protopterus annectens]|uniref:serine/threonine-protein phosphatase 4 regulatory subunit 1 isoform X1 n=3 Tax=Protopterus annectens TaxID=7888 RepID=UPI001CFAD2AA|nr:serine/threonine-protein phosphatase 4 regulatory subunit 1 isoform X1 [Protopterus annectens]